MQENPKFDLEDRLMDFTIMVMDIVEALPNTKAGNTIGNQLIRCCISPALNYGEARGRPVKRLNLELILFIR
jgi:four helix bundle protein